MFARSTDSSDPDKDQNTVFQSRARQEDPEQARLKQKAKEVGHMIITDNNTDWLTVIFPVTTRGQHHVHINSMFFFFVFTDAATGTGSNETT